MNKDIAKELKSIEAKAEAFLDTIIKTRHSFSMKKKISLPALDVEYCLYKAQPLMNSIRIKLSILSQPDISRESLARCADSIVDDFAEVTSNIQLARQHRIYGVELIELSSKTEAFGKDLTEALDTVVNGAEEQDGGVSVNFLASQKDILKKMIFLERTEARDPNAEYRATTLELILKLLYENENN